MLDFELTELDRQGDWRAVLHAYRTASVAAREADAASDGWTGRFPALDGFPPDQLACLHGRLIASGLLKFQVADRDAGLLYQLSPEGRRMLDGADPGTSDDPAET